jgi:hypothetical protein
MLLSIRNCAGGDSKLTEAVEFLNGPHFLPTKSNPADLKFKSKIHLNSHRRDRANLPKTTLYMDAFVAAQKIGRNPRHSFGCMAAVIL